MTKRGLIVASIIGLVAAIVAAILLNKAAGSQSIDLVVLGLDLVSAGIAGRVILGTARIHRYFSLGTVLFSAAAAIILTTAASNYLIHIDVAIGRPDYAPTSGIVVQAIVGFVVYLVAATIYGFAGTRQGVKVGGRIGLLALLLLAVLPLVNVLGLVGFTISAFVRGSATPVPAAASE
jgi:hypothetical protein